MAWADSRVFQEWIRNPMLGPVASLPTSFGGIVADTINAALFNNSVTPDRTAAVASTGYNTGTWVTANEVTGGSDWVSGGRALGTKAVTPTAGVVAYTAANLTSAAVATLTAYGLLVYDNTISGGTVAKQGICFNYFGGAQTVTGGTFSVNWNASGVFTATT